MFRITEDPSSGSFVQCLVKIIKMAVSFLLTWTLSVIWQHNLTLIKLNSGQSVLETDKQSKITCKGKKIDRYIVI